MSIRFAAGVWLALLLALSGCAYAPSPVPYYPSAAYNPPPPAYQAPFLGPLPAADAAPRY